MTRRTLLLALVVALAWAAPGRGAPAPASARALLARVRASGRAEASVRLRRVDPLSGRTIERGGRLALELPQRARLDLDDGERLTLRADGGDWLQPALKQLVRAGPRGAAGALRWWGALLDPAGSGLEERRAGERVFSLRMRGGDGTALQLELDAQGLPRRLILDSGDGGRLEYRLTRWRFLRPRGAADFVLDAPAGFEVVALP
jgi:hypothetical protein